MERGGTTASLVLAVATASQNKAAEWSGCVQGKLKQGCPICRGCPHGKLKHRCILCRGCPHGKLKERCRSCNGCPHGKLQYLCVCALQVHVKRRAHPRINKTERLLWRPVAVPASKRCRSDLGVDYCSGLCLPLVAQRFDPESCATRCQGKGYRRN